MPPLFTDTGFGSPTTIGGFTAYDAGFGSPSSIGSDTAIAAGGEHGAGSPSGITAIVPVIASTAFGAFGDDGGAIVRMSATWGEGPYYVRLLDGNGDVHPAVGFAWSGVPDQGSACYPKTNGEELTFVLPAVEAAEYAVRVYASDAGGSDYVDSINTLMVQRRTLYGASYRLRNAFPSHWLGPGRRSPQTDHFPVGYP